MIICTLIGLYLQAPLRHCQSFETMELPLYTLAVFFSELSLQGCLMHLLFMCGHFITFTVAFLPSYHYPSSCLSEPSILPCSQHLPLILWRVLNLPGENLIIFLPSHLSAFAPVFWQFTSVSVETTFPLLSKNSFLHCSFNANSFNTLLDKLYSLHTIFPYLFFFLCWHFPFSM